MCTTTITTLQRRLSQGLEDSQAVVAPRPTQQLPTVAQPQAQVASSPPLPLTAAARYPAQPGPTGRPQAASPLDAVLGSSASWRA